MRVLGPLCCRLAHTTDFAPDQQRYTVKALLISKSTVKPHDVPKSIDVQHSIVERYDRSFAKCYY